MNAPVEAGLAPYVLADSQDGVCTLTLNRGERFNPLSRAMIAALEAEIDRVARDDTVRVVVLAGTGKGFSAGHDLKELRAHPDLVWQRELFDACSRMMQKLTLLPQPVFALPGVNVGVFCSTPAVGVVRNVARKRTMEMLLTGEPIDAATALAWGLVNRVVPLADLDQAVAHYAAVIKSKSAHIVALGKRAFYAQVDRTLPDAYAGTGEVMAGNLLEADAGEGIDAFVEKRPPRWS